MIAKSDVRRPELGAVVVLLLAQFFLRAHAITVQPPFLNEAQHIELASIAWQFQDNPGSFSHGKLLTYYWLGLFVDSRETAIFVSRTAIALFSLLSGAAVYLLGRLLADRRVALLALTLYCALPLALFYERMALADPFAAGFSALIAWRSLVFARRPRLSGGAALGLLLALATLAKLTLAFLPLLPLTATILYFPPSRATMRQRVSTWLRSYLPGLILAAAIVGLLWAPVAIPAYVARNTDHPFALVDEANFGNPFDYALTVADKFSQVISDLASQNSVPFLAVFVLAAVYLLATARLIAGRMGALLLVCWLLLLILPSLTLASYTVTRYWMPTAAPIVLILSLAFWQFWDKTRAQTWIRVVLLFGAGAWMVGFALPFAYLAITRPSALPLTGNDSVYLKNLTTAGTDTQQVVDFLRKVESQVKQAIFADQRACALLYVASDLDVQCLPEGTNIPSDMRDAVQAMLKPNESAFLVARAVPEDASVINGSCVLMLATYEATDASSPYYIWQIQRPPCGSSMPGS